MDNSSQLLDQGLVEENKPLNIEANLASKGKRLGNLIIDQIILRVVVYGLGIAFATSNFMDGDTYMLIFPFLFLIWIGYYGLFEALTGRTPAKYLTGCKVVNIDGSPISMGQAIGRTFSRIIPFEAFSFLGEKGIGWHDSLANTRVINA